MSEQGGRSTGHEDAWWGQLYDGATDDTGSAPAPDSLDDRFDSAADTVNEAVGGPADAKPSAGDSSGTPPPAPPTEPAEPTEPMAPTEPDESGPDD
ncbi:hypothetical protein ABZ590_39660, partial [Streptomyces hirsutus]